MRCCPPVLPLLVVTAIVAAATATALGGGAHLAAARVAAAFPVGSLDILRLGAAFGALLATTLVLGGRLVADVRDMRVGAAGARGRGDLLGIGLAAGIGVAGHALLEPLARDMSGTAIGAGLGLLATSVAIGSIGVVRAPTSRLAPPPVAALAGGALALGALPGGAPIALGLAALAWSGLTELDALEIATLAAIPIHAVAFGRALDERTLAAVALDPVAAASTALAATLAAALGIVGLRRLARASSLAGVALYTGTVGFALLGYAYVAAP